MADSPSPGIILALRYMYMYSPGLGIVEGVCAITKLTH